MKKSVFGLFLIVWILAAPAAAHTPRPEHPRPDFMRESWQNLNGEWMFAFDPDDRGVEENWQDKNSLPGTISVPFPIESELSGVSEARPPEVSWYMRTFDADPAMIPGDKPGRVFLRFGAVDYMAAVWLNGVKLGSHTGGYTPFSFDVTGILKPNGNRLAVRVFDSLDRMQVRGKQSPTGKPYLIMYTTVTGIWQTVWLERTGDPYIKDFTFTSAKDLSGGKFELEIEGQPRQVSPRIKIKGPDGRTEPASAVTRKGDDLIWTGEIVEPWSPEYPALYEVELSLADRSGKTVDRVSSYVGVRTIEARGDRIYLNGRDFYQKLLLDQGYFPRGIYTPADDGTMKSDLEMYKRMGFNGLRKHQKIEDPRFLYWCDRLGLVVWEEMPSLGFGLPRKVPGWAMDRFEAEWMDVIERDKNHPSIITWAVYNETWGIYFMPFREVTEDWAYRMVRLTRQADPTRLVVDNSGGLHFGTDVFDFHQYLPTVEKTRWLYEKYDFEIGDHLGTGWYLMNIILNRPVLPIFYPGVDYQGQPVILSEYGGFGFYKTSGEKGLLELYRDYTLAIRDYPYIRGYCYTQPYDVQQEQNGLMSFDRKPKVEPEKIKQINDAMGRE